MKTPLILPALVLCAIPALAQSQSVSLLYSQLTTRDAVLTGKGALKFHTDKPTSFGLRYSHDIVSLPGLGDARLGFEGTWMRKSSTEDIKISEVILEDETFTYSHEYMGLGLSMMWTKGLDLGGALEVRHESNTQNISDEDMKVKSTRSYTRPWLSLRAGYTFRTSPVQPFIALEYSWPLVKKTEKADLEETILFDGTIAGNLNPKAQFTLNAGIRF